MHTYLYIHTECVVCLPVALLLVHMSHIAWCIHLPHHTTSSYMSHKVHDTMSNSEDYMITLNKRKTNSRTTVSKGNKPSISTNSEHIEVQTI